MSDAGVNLKVKGPVVVAAAIIENRAGEFLIAQRPLHHNLAGGLWEFPGGKVEPGEDPAACIVREIREELGVEISLFSQRQSFGVYSHVYISGTGEVPLETPVQIILIAYRARLLSQPSDITLTDVAAIRWVSRSVRPSEEFAPADLAILSDLYKR